MMNNPFYWKRPDRYPPELYADEGWYQLTKRGLVYLGETAINLDDIDEAAAAMLGKAEARIAELEQIRSLLKGYVVTEGLSDVDAIKEHIDNLKSYIEKLEDLVTRWFNWYEMNIGVVDDIVTATHELME
jgi:hypothetical protein